MRKKLTQTYKTKVGLRKKKFVLFFPMCMRSRVACAGITVFFSGGEVSEKVTISRKFKERVVQPILKVNIPLAINYSKPGKHFLCNKLQQTWVYKIKKNE